MNYRSLDGFLTNVFLFIMFAGISDIHLNLCCLLSVFLHIIILKTIFVTQID